MCTYHFYKKRCSLVCGNDIAKIGEKKIVTIDLEQWHYWNSGKKKMFDEKIVTSMVHCQTFELSRTQLDPPLTWIIAHSGRKDIHFELYVSMVGYVLNA